MRKGYARLIGRENGDELVEVMVLPGVHVIQMFLYNGVRQGQHRRYLPIAGEYLVNQLADEAENLATQNVEVEFFCSI